MSRVAILLKPNGTYKEVETFTSFPERLVKFEGVDYDRLVAGKEFVVYIWCLSDTEERPIPVAHQLKWAQDQVIKLEKELAARSNQLTDVGRTMGREIKELNQDVAMLVRIMRGKD